MISLKLLPPNAGGAGAAGGIVRRVYCSVALSCVCCAVSTEVLKSTRTAKLVESQNANPRPLHLCLVSN